MTSHRRPPLSELFSERILVLDGAMGTMLQKLGLGEAEYRTAELVGHPRELRGDHDLLVLSRPEVIESLHRAYLEAGADIIETCTFNAQRISQADYDLGHLVYQINYQAARLACRLAAEFTARTPARPRYVAGSIGPTTKTLSLPTSTDDPAERSLSFDQVREAYAEQIRALCAGGVDLLLFETVFDSLVLKAGIMAAEEVFEELGRRLPVMLSVTLDRAGRTLCGQTLEAFWASVAHARPLVVGLNCSLGPREMAPHVRELAALVSTWVSAHPNAGLPNALGEYEQDPATTSALLRELAEQGLLNLVGGCCGTTPEHIRALAAAVEGLPPRRPPAPSSRLVLSGLEALPVEEGSTLILVGERTSVAGSRRFAELVKSGQYARAVAIAVEQVRGGANLIDVNMDEALLDSEAAMTRFLRLALADPEVARLPVMLDSSRFSVLEAGLKCLPGKGVVNSLSLQEGEAEFLQRARIVQRYGAALVVMACDHQGPAESVERKVELCQRAYWLLRDKLDFPACDIIFDPGVLAIGTGIEAHADLAKNFIEATRIIRQTCPGCHVSGGVSNLSFAFRGHEQLRRALHAVFLYHARQAGLDFAIVNAGQLALYEELPQDLVEWLEDLVLNRRPDATERVLELGRVGETRPAGAEREPAWRTYSCEQRLEHAVVHGVVDHLEEDLNQARASGADPLRLLEGPLMAGMRRVGELFGAGKLFLPQVVRSARVMKQAVSLLLPGLEAVADAGKTRPVARVVLATVKGDVHDIGKNIVGVVLGCNGCQVIDLGVMVPAHRIVAEAEQQGADLIGVSGLITPSLDEMVKVAQEMERRGMKLPLLVGGATTSRQHTALRIAPEYSGPVVHVPDASRAPEIVSSLLDPGRRDRFIGEQRRQQAQIRERFSQRAARPLVPFPVACQRRLETRWRAQDLPVPGWTGRRVVSDLRVAELTDRVDWSRVLRAWELDPSFPDTLQHPAQGAAAQDLYQNARRLLERIAAGDLLRPRAVYGLWPAGVEDESLVLFADQARSEELTRFPMLRQQVPGPDGFCLSLVDFVPPVDHKACAFVGAFALTTGIGVAELAGDYRERGDDYAALLVQTLADRLAEALSELLFERVLGEWGASGASEPETEAPAQDGLRAIRPAFGYPACPDHSEKARLLRLLEAETLGISLTETCAMVPAASISGLYLVHPRARYFAVGRIGRDQVADYARRKRLSVAEVERWLTPQLDYETAQNQTVERE